MFPSVFLVLNLVFAVVAATPNVDLKSLLPKKFFLSKPLAELKRQSKTNSRLAPKALRVAAGNEDPRIVVYNQYSTADCSGGPSMAAGFSYNTCWVNSSPDPNTGIVSGSGTYRLTSEVPHFMAYLDYHEYSSSDCSETATYTENYSAPEICFPITDSTFAALKTVIVNTTDLSSALPGGILFSYFDTEDHCKTDSSSPISEFTWVKFGYCMLGDEGTSFMFTACGDGKISVVAYTDSACTTVGYKGDSPMEVCDPYPTGGGHSDSANSYYYDAFITHTCT